jgi:hypothetical protein
VWVQGKNSTGSGTISAPASGKPIGIIGTVTLSPGNTSIRASWVAVAGASQYEVYYSTSPSMPGTPAQTVTATQATINYLSNGTMYYVWIYPKNENGTGSGNYATGKPTAGELFKGAVFDSAVKIGSYDFDGALSYIYNYAGNGDNYFIVLGEDNTSNGGLPLLFLNKTVGITLMTDGVERTVQLASSGYILLSVMRGATLTLENNVTLQGRSDNTVSLVGIYSSGKFIMNGGKISGNNAPYSGDHNAGGGGVWVYGGTFTMNGGEISGNTASAHPTLGDGSGGGVFVYAGSFQMNGGTISGNTAVNNGGGVSVSVGGGYFTMLDGTISGNTAGNNGGGVHMGISAAAFGKLNTGGIIYGNNAAPATLKNSASGDGDAVYRENGSKKRNSTIPANEEFIGNSDIGWE